MSPAPSRLSLSPAHVQLRTQLGRRRIRGATWAALSALPGLVLGGCYGHHTADEDVLDPSEYNEEDGADGGTVSADGSAEDPCGDIADDDILGQVVCDFTAGGATGNLGTTDCQNPDNFNSAACQNTGNGQADALAGLLGLLGGGTGTTGGNTNTDALAGLLGLLGGGGTGTGTGTAAGGNNTAGAGLADLLGLLGGLGGGNNGGNNNNNNNNGGNNNGGNNNGR